MGHLPASPLNAGQAYRPPDISGLLLQRTPGETAATGSAGWQAIKLQSPHWYQQTSLSVLMGL